MDEVDDKMKEMGERGDCLRNECIKIIGVISSGFIEIFQYDLNWLSFGVKILADEIYCLVWRRRSAQS